LRQLVEGEAMLGTSLVILDEDPDITLLVTESNPKLLEAFADTVLSIERGEISVARAVRSGG